MPETAPRSLGPTGWAVYLGCSWTWCIGMFLPALLIRDLGLWGYVVFAVPNVVGAAAMGWVLRSPESSRRLVEDHKHAAVLFSRVTILFHFFWLGWLWTRFGAIGIHFDRYFQLTFLLLMLFLVCAIVIRLNDRRTQAAALLIWLASASLLVVLAANPDMTVPTTTDLLREQPFSNDVLWLLPASAFGFAFCPYLDLTFHHARQQCQTPNSSRFAFGMGFGVFFFSMILLTVLYSGLMVAFVMSTHITINTLWIIWALAAHLLLQLAFTVTIHRKQLLRQLGNPTPPRLSGIGIACLVSLVAGGLCIWLDVRFQPFGMPVGEIGYRAFLTFYGLIFPAYVYLNIWNIRGRRLRARTPRSLRVTIIAILLASPFFFMGFFVRDERYIPAGVAILLLAKLFTGSDARPAPLTQPA